jgi:hypothetical protein
MTGDSDIFDYIDFPRSRPRKRPVISIPFLNLANGAELSFTCLIDSGADESISFKSIGEAFGLDFSRRDKTSVDGLTGSCDGWKAPISFKVANRTITLDVIWLDKEFDEESDYPFVLGRNGIFKEFHIIFRADEKVAFLPFRLIR